jgi:hypothetical protein
MSEFAEAAATPEKPRRTYLAKLLGCHDIAEPGGSNILAGISIDALLRKAG